MIDKDEILDVCANEVEPLETAPAAVFMAWIDQITKYGWFVRNYNDKEVHLRHPQRPSGICLQLHGAGVQAEPEPVVSVPKTRTPVHIEPKRRRPIRSGDDVRYR